MANRKLGTPWILAVLICVWALPATAQSFRVQCPASTLTHPANLTNVNAEPPYVGPTTYTAASATDYLHPTAHVNGAIKCQQISGGDGFSTMADGTQTFMFSFGPLSGLSDIANGRPGTQFPAVFNAFYTGTTPLSPGDPATTVDAPTNSAGMAAFTFNGAVGLMPNVGYGGALQLSSLTETGNVVTATIVQSFAPANTPPGPPNGLVTGVQVVISGVTPAGYNGMFPITVVSSTPNTVNGVTTQTTIFQYAAPTTGLAPATSGMVSAAIDGHVDPRQIMDVGVMNGNIPAPLAAFDEDDEFFLTLTNVGMIQRPDLFEQHTVHFHGYPNASSVYDGVPDASVAINIGGSFTYYYLAPDAGTYFWHCHITPPEHLQMGMVGQLYVRPRQNRAPQGTNLYASLQLQQTDNRTKCDTTQDILCSNPLPAINTGAVQGVDKLGNPQKYVYNDGDASTAYDVEYPLQIHGFDPNFHFVGMTFNPEAFVDMKDKYFLLNGRSYPDTVAPGPQQTTSADGKQHFSQPLPAIINIPVGGKALLRIADLDVTEYQTLASLGIPMSVIGFNAKLLRDQSGNNLIYKTNSITLGGGESLDVILDASDTTKYQAGQTFYLYTPNLDHLSNDAENFGGLMTEVHICNSVTGGNTFGNTCN